MKKKELLNIKNSVDTMYNRTIISPQAKQIINRILAEQTLQKSISMSKIIGEQLSSIGKRIVNLKEILKEITEDYDNLIREISSISSTIDLNNLNKSINNLIRNANNFLITLNEKMQEFDSESKNILTNLENIKRSINEIPDQERRALLHKTIQKTETTIKNYHQGFLNYYNQYQTIKELIFHLQPIKNDMEELENQIKELNDYYNKFRQENDPRKKNTIAGRFIDSYNKNTKNLINKIIQNISGIPTPMITRSLYTAIENLKTNLRTAIRELNNDIKQKYEEMKYFHDDWSRQMRNQRQQNHQQNNRGGNRNIGRHRR